MGRSASQDQKARRASPPVRERPQDLEQLWLALDLVDHDETLEGREAQFRLGEACPPRSGLEIEDGSILAAANNLVRERGLAALARAKQSTYRVMREDSLDLSQLAREGDKQGGI